MIYLLRLFLNHEYRLRFSSVPSILIFIFSILATLFSYYWTSQALGSQLEKSSLWAGMSYFQFVLMGEFLMIIPMSLLEAPLRFSHLAIQANFIEEIFWNSDKPQRVLFYGAVSLLLKDLISLVLYFLCLTYFLSDFFTVEFLIRFVLTTLISLPCFLFLGMILSSVYFIFRRGAGVLSQFGYLTSLLSGIFFPLAVFSKETQTFIKIISPFAYFVDFNREAQQQSFALMFEYLLFMIFWGLLGFVATKFIMKIAIRRYLQKPPAAIST